MKRPWFELGALALGASALLATGCGESAGPVETGRVDIVLNDDPGSSIAFGLHAPFRFAHHKNFGDDYFHGTLTGTVQLQLSTDGVIYHDLGAFAEVAVSLQDEDAVTRLADRSRVPEGSYQRLRLVLTGAAARIDEGAQVGGLDLESPALVAIDDGEVAIIDLELSTPLIVLAGVPATLILDWNAEEWVTEDHILEGRVASDLVRQAVRTEQPVTLSVALDARV